MVAVSTALSCLASSSFLLLVVRGSSVGGGEAGGGERGGGTGDETRHLTPLSPPPYFLNFDTILNSDIFVNDYYSGANGGPNYGIVFGPAVRTAISGFYGGPWAVANIPTPNTTIVMLSWLRPPEEFFMTVGGGFNFLSFLYSNSQESNVTLYDGPNGTGTPIAFGSTQAGGLCSSPCGEAPGGDWYSGNWFNFTLVLPAGIVAKSVLWVGMLGFIDNVEIRFDVPPTMPPTDQPTKAPTKAPSRAPTKSPTSCDGATTYWAYNVTPNLPVRQIAPNAVTCLIHPYSIQVRPCINGSSVPPTLPVVMKLAKVEPNGRTTLVRRQADSSAPFFLYGDTNSAGAALPSPGRLPNGMYRLSSNVGNSKVAFTQLCCPKGKKGVMGMCKP